MTTQKTITPFLPRQGTAESSSSSTEENGVTTCSSSTPILEDENNDTTSTTSTPPLDNDSSSSPSSSSSDDLNDCVSTTTPGATPSWVPRQGTTCTLSRDPNGGTYCQICDITVKDKRNLNRHLKSKRHKDNEMRATVAVDNDHDDGVNNTPACNRDPAEDNSQEHGFAVACKSNRGGKNFFITVQRPVKYRIAKYLSRRLFTCMTCCMRFRSAGLLRRHKSDSLMHRFHVKQKQKLKKYKMMWHEVVSKYMSLRKKKRLPVIKRQQQKEKKRDRLRKQQRVMEMAVICNEFTNDRFPHSHSHMYLKTKTSYTFKAIKKYCRKQLKTKISDIQRPINFCETVRYITKTDPKALVYNVPTKFCSTVWRANMYAQTHKSVIWSNDIPSSIAACDRQVFASHVEEERKANEAILVHERTNQELSHWQKRLLSLIDVCLTQDRAVFWIVDGPGGCGKSFLSQKLIATKDALLLGNFAYKDNAFLYQGEPWVVFDIPRDTDLTQANLQIIEDLKNGYIISQKYEVKRKIFTSPTVVVFTNTFPPKREVIFRPVECVCDILQPGPGRNRSLP